MLDTSTNILFFYSLLIIRYTLIRSANKFFLDSSLETKIYANSDFLISLHMDVLVELDKKYRTRIFSDTMMARFLVEEEAASEFWL